jgi:type II secretory pathway component PulF
MAYRFEAINAAGQAVIDTIEAASAVEAAELARQRGMFVTRIEEAGDAQRRTTTGRQNRGGGRLKG